MIKDIKNILIIILFVIIGVLLFMKGCGNVNIKPKQNDTISYTIRDTVWNKDTLIKFKPIIRPKYDTIYQIDTLKYNVDTMDLFLIREYNDSLKDTNQTIYWKAITIGMLDTLKISYKPVRKPILINNNTITTITKYETKTPRFSIYTGLEVGGNKSTFNLSPFINLNIKNNNVYYRYGVLDKTHNIGIGIKLLKSKK